MRCPNSSPRSARRWGSNQPLWQQYLAFLKSVATFDLGRSLIQNRPVLDLIAYNLPYTIELTRVRDAARRAGRRAARRAGRAHRNRLPDAAVRLYSLIGYAIPDFYLGALLLIGFRAEPRLVPGQRRRRRIC